jgi:glycosyltransferase involved in cell wall biosynthesis
MPRVTVGVPVYNGGLLLRESLECLRTQSFEDFVVVMSDNASTDATGDICAEYAARDPRFVHRRRAETVPAVRNFQDLCDAAKTELFLWRAHDDLSAPDYLERLVALFDEGPQVALAVGSVRSIRTDGSKERLYAPPARRGGVAGLWARLFGSHASWIYGLWRADAIRAAYAEAAARYDHAWAQDHLILLPFLLDDAVRWDASAVFLQRMVDDPAKAPPRRPTHAEMSGLRAAYAAAAADHVAARRWSPAERLALGVLMPFYVDRRCYSRIKLARMAVRERLGLT